MGFVRRAERPGAGAAPRVVLLAIVLALLGGAAGAVWGERRSAVHEATAVILLNPTEGNPFGRDSGSGADLVNLETEAELVVSDEVAQLVADRLGSDEGAAASLEGVSTKVPANTQLIEVTVADKGVDTALDRAQAFADVFLDYRKSRTEVAVFERGAAIREEIQVQSEELDGYVLELDRAEQGTPDALLLQQQIIEVNDQLGQLRAQVAGLDATPVDPGQVVSPAVVESTGPIGLRELGALLGLLAGAAAGFAWGVSRLRLQRWVRGPDDVADIDPPLLASLDRAMPGADDLARLRANLLDAVERRPLSMLATGPNAANVLAAPLARSLARANLEVIRVVATGAAADRPDGPGLADLLRAEVDPDDVLTPVVPHLSVIGPGTAVEELDDLVMAPEMEDLLDDLTKRADVVILEGCGETDPRTLGLARLADLVVLEVMRGRTTAAAVEEAAAGLGHPDQRPVGLVLVPAPRRARR